VTYNSVCLAVEDSRYIPIFSFTILELAWPAHTVIGEEVTSKSVILGRAVSRISVVCE
jgi:hypothetical protein